MPPERVEKSVFTVRRHRRAAELAAGMAQLPTEAKPTRSGKRALAGSTRWCRRCSAPKKAFYTDGSKIKLRQALAGKDNTWDNCLVDVALSKAFSRKRTTHFVRLPAHVTVEQIRALRRVFCVPNGQRKTPRLAKWSGGVLRGVRHVPQFFDAKDQQGQSEQRARGFRLREKSLVCDEDPTKFYCGRKPATAEESSARGAKTGKALRHARFYGKHCSDTKLTFVNLIGRLLVFRSKIYGICCFCANYFMLQGDSWHGASLCCGRCIDAQGRKLYETAACDWCGKRCRSTNLTCSCGPRTRRGARCAKPAANPPYLTPTYSLDWQIMCNELCGVSKHKH